MHAFRRHDIISDAVWVKLEPLLPGREGSWGGKAQDNRRFINAVFWIMRTGAPWRALPPDFGGWSNTHRRFIRWRDNGVWERLLEMLIDEPGFEWLMINVRHYKTHPHESEGRNSGRAKRDSTQNCLWPWIRMVCRSGILLNKVQQRIENRKKP